jgi:glucose/mannose-6-phosphate isomerase
LIDLDDATTVDRFDSLGVLATIERFADQMTQAWELGADVRGLPVADGVENVVVLGIGGSGFAGDVLRTLLEARLPVPIAVVKGYAPLPEWVGRNSLVFAVSYSGNTEETLDAFRAAHDRGARLVAVASGGELSAAAATSGCALVSVPGGAQPRASLGFLALPLVAVLQTLGLAPDMREDVTEAIEVVDGLTVTARRDVPTAENPAKQLARIIAGRAPVFYGGRGIGAAAAYRAKCDVNEYAKQPAFWNEVPEMNHNEIAGWSTMTGVTQLHMSALFLRDPHEDPRIAARLDATRRLVRPHVADALEVWAEGDSATARLFHLVTLTQLAAIYAALLNAVDPGPVDAIERLKRDLIRATERGVTT